MGETRVDLLHLLEDLRDAYPGTLEETILTEIVANALDSGAHCISFHTDATAATLTVVDDGVGMSRRELARYHDLAASSKRRGRTIGFAGVGIKLGLLVAGEVFTETRRGRTHIASTWHLSSRHRAPWKWAPPAGLIFEHGTAVRLKLTNGLSALLDGEFIAATIVRHFEPLLDPTFEHVLGTAYRHRITFNVNGVLLTGAQTDADRVPFGVRVGRRRKPSGSGYLQRSVTPLPEDARGIAISTLGKVIKRGWEWLGITPVAAAQISGTIEIPALAESLSLNKADFIRTGPRGAVFLGYRKAIQEAVSAQLATWGELDAQPPQRPHPRKLERDLENVLIGLAHDFPLLATLVSSRTGAQRRIPFATAPAQDGSVWPAPSAVAGKDMLPDARENADANVSVIPSPTTPDAQGAKPDRAAAVELPPDGQSIIPAINGRPRPLRYGLNIEFETRPDLPELGRLIQSTVWVNDAHPAFQRALRMKSESYHIALTVGMALAPLAVESSRAHAFISMFLAHWGGAPVTRGKRSMPGDP